MAVSAVNTTFPDFVIVLPPVPIRDGRIVSCIIPLKILIAWAFSERQLTSLEGYRIEVLMSMHPNPAPNPQFGCLSKLFMRVLSPDGLMREVVFTFPDLLYPSSTVVRQVELPSYSFMRNPYDLTVARNTQ